MLTGISYTLKHSGRASRLKIHLDGQGQVIVTAPHYVSPTVVAQFVEASRAWIQAQRLTLARKPLLLSTRSVLYFGASYAVKVSKRFDGTIKVGRDVIIVSPLSDQRVAENTLALLSSWLKSQAIAYVSQRVYELSSLMQLPFQQLAFKQQKTRWGSCSSKKNLNFNWKLIHAPKEVIDYVIIHELAHTQEMNHGRRFWDLVARFDPDYVHHRRWLSRYGSVD